MAGLELGWRLDDTLLDPRDAFFCPFPRLVLVDEQIMQSIRQSIFKPFLLVLPPWTGRAFVHSNLGVS